MCESESERGQVSAPAVASRENTRHHWSTPSMIGIAAPDVAVVIAIAIVLEVVALLVVVVLEVIVVGVVEGRFCPPETS